MNFSKKAEPCSDSSLMQSVIRIMNTPHLSEQQVNYMIEPRSFIKVKSKSEVQVEIFEKTIPNSINQFGYDLNSN